MVVYTLELLRQIDLQKMQILAKKNHLFRWSLFWSSFWKLSHLGHRKPPRKNWKADAPKTSHSLMRILVQRNNWTIFSSKMSYSQWRSLSGHVEWIFVHINWRGVYWQHTVSTGRRYVPHSQSYTRWFASCFWRSHYQPQSWCRFDTVVLLFVGCRQRQVLRRQARGNWRLKGQYSWSHWWNTTAHNR